jgi:hypothetical protein
MRIRRKAIVIGVATLLVLPAVVGTAGGTCTMGGTSSRGCCCQPCAPDALWLALPAGACCQLAPTPVPVPGRESASLAGTRDLPADSPVCAGPRDFASVSASRPLLAVHAAAAAPTSDLYLQHSLLLI